MTDTKDRDAAMAARFAKDTEHHKLFVRHDDGLYRHLKCVNPARSAYWFELITSPGQLTFSGDMESFVFRRLDDMFSFFRGGEGGRINPVYWAQKVTSGWNQLKEYDQNRFRSEVLGCFDDAVRDGTIAKADEPKARRKLFAEVLTSGAVMDEETAREALDSFAWKDFTFTDTWEMDFRSYRWTFLWACHAIVWGIAQYDVAQEPKTGEGR